jgi:hypothetical protein
VGRNRIFVLTDRCGFIMGRSRRLDEILVVLAGLLSSFLEQPEGSQRFRMRILAREGSAYLCVPPVLFSEPPIERLLHKRGVSVVDRMVVDLAVDSPRITDRAVPWQLVGAGVPGVGHMTPGSCDLLEIKRVLIPAETATERLSRATTVAAIAESAVAGSRGHSLSVALQVEALGTEMVPLFGGMTEVVKRL